MLKMINKWFEQLAKRARNEIMNETHFLVEIIS